MLVHKTSLNKFKNNKIIQSIYSDHNRSKLKIRKRICIEKFNIVMTIITKIIYRFNEIAIQFLTAFLHKWKGDPKIHMELQGILNKQSSPEKEPNRRNHTY